MLYKVIEVEAHINFHLGKDVCSHLVPKRKHLSYVLHVLVKYNHYYIQSDFFKGWLIIEIFGLFAYYKMFIFVFQNKPISVSDLYQDTSI